MKSVKYFALMTVVILSLLLAACQPPAAAPAPSAEKPVEKPLRIAVIMPSSIKDMAFSQSMYDALTTLQKEMGGESKMELKYSENMFKVPDAAAAIRDYATQGFDIVIAHGSQYGSSIAQVAPDFPKTSFAHGTTANTFNSEGITNVFAYEARTQDAGYVIGVEMAMLSKSGKIGWCGPVNSGDHGLFFKGFKQAIAATKPDAKISEAWTGNYSDVSLMSACAETAIQAGADVITGGAQAYVGAIGVAKDKKVLSFGSQWDQASLAPDSMVASYIYNWQGVVKDIIATRAAGVMGGKIYTATFKNGGVAMKYNDAYKLDPAIKAAGDAALEGLNKGEIKIDLTAK